MLPDWRSLSTDFHTVLPVLMTGRGRGRIAVSLTLRCRLRCSVVYTKQPAMRSAACTRGSPVLAGPTRSVPFGSAQSLYRLNTPPSTLKDVGLHSIVPKHKEFCSWQSYTSGTMETYWGPREEGKDPGTAAYLKIVAAIPLWNKWTVRRLIWRPEWNEALSKKSWQVVTGPKAFTDWQRSLTDIAFVLLITLESSWI